MNVQLGTVIARREITVDGGSPILVEIGAPQPFDDDGGWYCPYQIMGVGDQRVRYAGGVDAVQAFQLTLQKVGADLERVRVTEGKILRWHGELDLGFA